jgi:hypothetical protein
VLVPGREDDSCKQSYRDKSLGSITLYSIPSIYLSTTKKGAIAVFVVSIASIEFPRHRWLCSIRVNSAQYIAPLTDTGTGMSMDSDEFSLTAAPSNFPFSKPVTPLCKLHTISIRRSVSLKGIQGIFLFRVLKSSSI